MYTILFYPEIKYTYAGCVCRTSEVIEVIQHKCKFGYNSVLAYTLPSGL
jgi:hypothetical protein